MQKIKKQRNTQNKLNTVVPYMNQEDVQPVAKAAQDVAEQISLSTFAEE